MGPKSDVKTEDHASMEMIEEKKDGEENEGEDQS